MSIMLLLAIAAQALDGITFAEMVSRYGMAAEANPFARADGLVGALVLKLIFLGVTGGFTFAFGRRFPRATAWALGIIFAAGTIGFLSNVGVFGL